MVEIAFFDKIDDCCSINTLENSLSTLHVKYFSQYSLDCGIQAEYASQRVRTSVRCSLSRRVICGRECSMWFVSNVHDFK